MAKTFSPAAQPATAGRELSLTEIEAVAGGAKGDSGGLEAAKSIDLTAFLAQMDKAIAKLKQI